jgi:hypothetical protein
MLEGDGQVITVGDTGCDLLHCMFHDPDQEIVHDKVNLNHRKIVYYRVAAAGIDRASESFERGHGTHVVRE